MAPNCALDISICRNILLQDFVKENCKRTCGYCSQTSAATVKPMFSATLCGSDPNCVNWVMNGFCNSIFYTQEQKRQYCGTYCGLC
ncbi:shTK domain protein [Necator americanus]|uniref:ShTK domain protein n=1 Tax=Necator americanus TaxID=51031 RepID=W2TCI6_NECAM|nr:shTK domain protein [Necator americanus]ETN78727.1 shTK domain protein [Necator americanus]